MEASAAVQFLVKCSASRMMTAATSRSLCSLYSTCSAHAAYRISNMYAKGHQCLFIFQQCDACSLMQPMSTEVDCLPAGILSNGCPAETALGVHHQLTFEYTSNVTFAFLVLRHVYELQLCRPTVKQRRTQNVMYAECHHATSAGGCRGEAAGRSLVQGAV